MNKSTKKNNLIGFGVKYVLKDKEFKQWKNVNKSFILKKKEDYSHFTKEEFELNLYDFYLWVNNVANEKLIFHKNRELVSSDLMNLHGVVQDYISDYSGIKSNKFSNQLLSFLEPNYKDRKYRSNFLLAVTFRKIQSRYIQKALYIQNLYEQLAKKHIELITDNGKRYQVIKETLQINPNIYDLLFTNDMKTYIFQNFNVHNDAELFRHIADLTYGEKGAEVIKKHYYDLKKRNKI